MGLPPRNSRFAPVPERPESAPRSYILRRNILTGKNRSGRLTGNAPSSPAPASSRSRNLKTLASDIPVQCRIKESCQGCAFVNTAYEASLKVKFDKGIELLNSYGLLSGAHIAQPQGSPLMHGYRTLFKLAVRPYSEQVSIHGYSSSPKSSTFSDQTSPTTNLDTPRRFALGLFQPGTHNIGPNLERCPIHAHALAELIRDLPRALDESPLTPFIEKNEIKAQSGQLRYVVARSAHLTGEIMLTFIVTTPPAAVKMDLQRVTAKLRSLGHKIHAVFINTNADPGNAIFGSETSHLFGNSGLRESLCDLSFEIAPTAFFQINPWQAGNLYRRIEQLVGSARSGASIAWDLYCGIGQISLILARLGYRTFGIEENPEAIANARLNATRNRIANAEFLAAKVEDCEEQFPKWASNPDLIVVNPSRRGLHESARSHLAHILRTHEKSRFVYVSCEVSTLARDLQALTAAGFRLRQLEAFDMFAQTDKLEWLAVMTK